MATKEEISMVGFEIVAYAGDAQTDLLAALDAAREGDFEKAEQLHKDASDALIGAHDTQTKLLSQEAGGGEMEMTFIMAHAQDTLMTTMILEKQTRFTIDAYKRIAELDRQLERDNARMKELLELMADPDFYINEAESSDAIAEHGKLKARIAAAEEEWFLLNEELEEEMRKQQEQA